MNAPRHTHFEHLIDLTHGRIDRSIFTDPRTYELELERVFARCWLFLGHESLLPRANDYFTTYMGQDPVIVTKKPDGTIGCYLNMCRHRGNRVCRADAGNARAFTCPFHGWTFSNDGRLSNVPGYKEIYLEKLDLDAHGLVPVAQIASYKGLLFATFNADAPSLTDYLGDMAWYLDMILDRRAGGIEFIGGAHKWLVRCNWKFPADNFIGDSYHGPVSHKSAWTSGFEGMPRRKSGYGYEGFQVNPGGGHGFGTRWAESKEVYVSMALPEFEAYERSRMDEAEQRLGALRGVHFSPMHATIFPNMSLLWQGGAMRIWHPKGPNLTEAWGWCFVDKNAPDAHKAEIRVHELQRHGTSGTWEADDVDNWMQCSSSSAGYVARQYPQNLEMGLGDEIEDPKAIHPDIRGRLGKFQSEINQRGFYRRWAELMDDPAPPRVNPRTQPAGKERGQ